MDIQKIIRERIRETHKVNAEYMIDTNNFNISFMDNKLLLILFQFSINTLHPLNI